MKINFALVGNPNSGKTTLFNQMTGSSQRVGNFPGVTVEKKDGQVRGHKGVTVTDLPGIYSLSPYTAEEVLTRDFLIFEKPDAIINIIDATNIERNLYLTLQLMELNVPMILALNMMDEIRGNGISIDIQKLETLLGVPVVPISASKNDGVDELTHRSIKCAETKTLPKNIDFCSGYVHNAIHSIAHLITDEARAAGLPLRFAATKIAEGDRPVIERLKLMDPELDIIQHIVDDMESHLNTDREAAMADMRYCYIENLCRACITKAGDSREQLRSIKIDSVLTHRYFAIPIFLGIMFFIFWLTFNVFGSGLSDLLSAGIDRVTAAADRGLSGVNVNPALHSLIINGIFAGVGSVLSFLPIIVVLFFFLSILEDSGYMARIAFVMDKLLRKIGLSGRSFVPMLIGFGCSVPAIMASRTLPSERDRKMTIILTPFMSCSAKLPIYAMFTAAFFVEYQSLVMIGLYVMGMVVAIAAGLLLKKTVFEGKPVPFVMELPSYRLPAAKSVLLKMWERAMDFIKRAFTVIFIATIIIWALQSFDFGLNMVADAGNSILATAGKLIAPVFAPLGFADWRAATALVTGLTAKEAVVSTFAILLGASDASSAAPLLSEIFNPLSAFAFLTFTLLYMPCVAAMAAMKREMGGWRNAVLAMAFQTVTAWVVAFVVYRIGLLSLMFI
ncbi:MAG TPA: ferrous iron transport protein B [Anaerovoracaceae bacterium]|nr:ferrous iron transport protein B [Anaerovoracaceae bacterium]